MSDDFGHEDCSVCDRARAAAVSDRERFLVTLAYTRPSHADVIVCLAGEDGEDRAFVAAELFKMQMAPGVLITGGRHEPPTITGAKALEAVVWGRGVAPDRTMVDERAQNTRQQAVNTIATAQTKGWKRLILCASAAHIPRAYLTFLRALQEAKQDETICIVPAAVLGGDQFGARLDAELEKVADYGEIGHVATYREGLDYLSRWST